jgi:hypothetical protein
VAAGIAAIDTGLYWVGISLDGFDTGLYWVDTGAVGKAAGIAAMDTLAFIGFIDSTLAFIGWARLLESRQ